MFRLDLAKLPSRAWLILGECESKVEHLAGVALKPAVVEEFLRLHLARGLQGTAAIEGNTLTEDQVRARVEGKSRSTPSLAYMETEIDNLKAGYEAATAQMLDATGPVCFTGGSFHDWNRFILCDMPLEGDQPGVVSRGPVGVAGYSGAPREDCDHLLNRLAQWLNADMGIAVDGLAAVGKGLIKAITAHLYLAWIHPWVDGNGRTARLAEYAILLAAGVPTPAAHLLSNFYSQTRLRYFDELARASRSGGDVVPFLLYAVEGFRDEMRAIIEKVREHQLQVAWESYMRERFKSQSGKAATRRQRLLEMLTDWREPITAPAMLDRNLPFAVLYAERTTKTLMRDLNALATLGLVIRSPQGFLAYQEKMRAFLPRRRKSGETESML